MSGRKCRGRESGRELTRAIRQCRPPAFLRSLGAQCFQTLIPNRQSRLTMAEPGGLTARGGHATFIFGFDARGRRRVDT